MKPYENWNVWDVAGTTVITYGDDTPEDILWDNGFMNDVSAAKIPQEEWSANNWAEICGNELEDANRHDFVDLPSNFCQTLKRLDGETQRAVMKDFALCLWDCI